MWILLQWYFRKSTAYFVLFYSLSLPQCCRTGPVLVSPTLRTFTCFPCAIHQHQIKFLININSSPPSATYMRQWTGSSLVQVIACRLFGTKPLPEPMRNDCQLDSWEQISVKFESDFYRFHSRKCNWQCRLPKWRPFCPEGDELKSSLFVLSLP